MKFLLLLTLFHPGYATDVIKYEVASDYQCQEKGAGLARSILVMIPGVSNVQYECIDRDVWTGDKKVSGK